MSKKSNAQKCTPDEVALKSFFLGPQAENSEYLLQELQSIYADWIDWRKKSYPQDGLAIPKSDQESAVFQKKLHMIHREVEKVSLRFQDELPKFSPRYIGHMLSEFSMPALLGHFVTLLHNPNNISKEASLVGVEFEKEAIADLGKMLGFGKKSIGHFTSGGTIANFEAVLRAKNRWLRNLQNNDFSKLSFNEASYFPKINPSKNKVDLALMSDFMQGKWIEKQFQIDYRGPVLLVPESKHYSWTKAANYFGLGKNALIGIELDQNGMMDMKSLQKSIDACLKNNRPILAIVSVCGTTELASIDPIHKIQRLIKSYDTKYGFQFWHHTDAAYGGFFTTLKEIQSALIRPELMQALMAMGKSTSITIDPHKLGYVPYASGAFLCKQESDYFLTEAGAPYLAFDRKNDRGPYTLEGSRSAAGAVATYLTSRCIGLNQKGYGKIIHRSIQCCALMKKTITEADLPILFANESHTNILGFAVGKPKMKLSQVNAKTLALIKVMQENSKHHELNSFFISKTRFSSNFSKLIHAFAKRNQLVLDTDELVIVRLTMMNPFLNSRHTKTNFIKEFTAALKQGVIDVNLYRK